MLIKIKEGWKLSESEVAPEEAYFNRRAFLRKLGWTGLGVIGLQAGWLSAVLAGQGKKKNGVWQTIPDPAPPYPVPRNPRYTADRPLTPEEIAASYNNFYEFTMEKDRVWQLAKHFETQPWKIEIRGEVHKPMTLDLDDLLKRMPLEERIYRHRCVEAWSMVVPWSGFAFKRLVDLVQPTSKAQYVRMVSFLRPSQAPGQKQRHYPWPYFEGLTMAEATNELTFLATGIYGHALPPQHGAPIRLVTPWKYGFKSIKSIVLIEFTRKQPRTFWNDLVPDEYDFWANVNPKVPHPRWSQATERDIGTGKRIPTRLYNGYEAFVAHLYRG
ncbi:MAG: protein-methionine-sulfoxide reductase catalytic subunit MsrP [candidate division KSB1 bacterium]|nr:protein-methionine-sulfoxide reductase catalytic subunit MsrP [candidate division KSB1 bacterium]